MPGRISGFLVGMSFLLLAGVASAAQEAVALDHKVMVDDPQVAAVLRKAVGTPLLSETIAREFAPMLYSDNKLTRNESDLLIELLHAGATPITVTTASGDTFKIPPPSKGAQDFLALSNPPDLNTLWLQGPDAMRKLADVTYLNPNVTGQVQRYIAQNIFASWQASQATHSTKPLRETVTTALDQWRVAGGPAEVRGKELLYGALKDVDAAVKGAIPDDIYAELKPASGR